jgi:prepilin-type N-terminal cleavage/methylation domain-containing protein
MKPLRCSFFPAFFANIPLRNRRGPGFSIIEIIMVLVILGILAGLAIPRFATFFVMKLEGGRKKVIYDIRFVQQMAVARHTNTRIVFNAGNETYVAQEESPQGSGTWVSINSPFTRAPLQANFTSDYQFNGINITSASFGGPATLQFDWKGIPTSGGTVVLTYKGESRTITIESNTGFVR